MASSGNQDLLFVLGISALASVDGMTSYHAVERRHPDGERWVEVGRFATKEDATAALDTIVAGKHAEADELRVHHVRIQAH